MKPELKGMALTLAGICMMLAADLAKNIGIVYLFGFVLVISGAMVRRRGRRSGSADGTPPRPDMAE